MRTSSELAYAVRRCKVTVEECMAKGDVESALSAAMVKSALEWALGSNNSFGELLAKSTSPETIKESLQ